MRKMRLIHEYMGVTIFRQTEPGSRLRWTASCNGPLAADTLAGIKELIRERKKESA